MITADRSVIGVGLYTASQAAGIIRVSLEGKEKLPSTSTIRRWLRGTVVPYGEERREYAPIVQDQIPGDPHFSFVNFIELWFITFFRSEGVSFQVIRKAAEEATRLLGPHPFALHGFSTDGASIFADLRERGTRIAGLPERTVMEELNRGQIVMRELVKPYLREITWGEDFASMFWPCGPERGIVLDPTRCFGQPIVAEDAIPTRALYRRHKAGDAMELLAEWYRTSVEAVRAAIEFEQQLEMA